MKKIYMLLAIAFGIATTSSAQRLVDLRAEIVSPAANASIASGQTFNTDFVVRNAGTVAFKATDTVLYGYAIDNTLLQFTVNGQQVTTFFRTGKALNPGDTMQINRSFAINFPSTLNGAHVYCAVINVMNRSADSVRDNVTGNNDSCRNVTFTGGVNSVASVTGTLAEYAVTNVFPNPATAHVNFEVKMGANNNVMVKVLDLTGRTVYQENRGTLTKGVHTIRVNTASFAPGLYLYQVVMGEEVSSGKFSVTK